MHEKGIQYTARITLWLLSVGFKALERVGAGGGRVESTGVQFIQVHAFLFVVLAS
jgi:hypothetical protein